MGAGLTRAYWEDRLARAPAGEADGSAGLGAAFNRGMERVRTDALMRELAPFVGDDPQRLRVLDVGSGSGAVVAHWHALGVTGVTGSDIADVAVQRLRERFPDDEFVRLDIAEDGLGERRFDAVSAVNVVFHLLDDDAYERAFANLYALLEPGGLLVFTENFLHGEELRFPHQVSRTLAHIERVVGEAGFEIVRRRPLFVLMNAPHDSRSRLHRLWWRGLSGLAARSETFGRAACALLAPLERRLVARAGEGPSTELMLCRRPPA